jgi:hypothetical protein
MTTYKEIIVDAITGEEVIKPYTAEQIAEAEAGAMEAAKLTQAQAKAEADKAAAQAKLAALGLTTDDLKALGL